MSEEQQEYTEAAEPVEAEAQEYEAEEGEGEPPAPTWSEDDEADARFYGWKPASEWRGDLPDNYVHDPLEFIANSPVAKKVKQKEAEKEAEYKRRFDKLERMTQTVLSKTKAQYEQRLADLEARKLAAVQEADTDAYNAAVREEQGVRKDMQGFDEEPEPQEDKQRPEPNAEAHQTAVQKYIARNATWWNVDRVMTSSASAAYEDAMAQGITDPDARLEYVDAKMAEYFPDRMGKPKPQRRQAPAVGDGLTLGGPRKKDGFDALPKEARDQFKAFVGQGVYADTAEDRAHYTEQYNAA